MSFVARSTVVLLLGAAALVSCGGDAVGDAVHHGSSSPAPATVAAAGIYVGYYQEDPVNDTSDPAPGALVLNLPASNATALTGTMDFDVYPCRTGDAIPLAGTRSDLGLNGTFTGPVAGVAQTGSFTGTLDTTALSFSGTYINAGGKQAVAAVTGCAAYTLAANGSIELFPVDQTYPPTDFKVSYDTATRTITWSPITGGSKALVYVADGSLVTSGSANPVPWQQVLDSAISTTVPTGVALTPGHTYYAVVELAKIGTNTRTRVAFGSKSFVAP